MCLGSLLALAFVAPACGSGSSSAATPSPSVSPERSPQASPYFDPAPRELVANFAPGIGGEMACSDTTLVFADGPLHVLYSSTLGRFEPRALMTAGGSIGPLSMSGTWVTFAVYRQQDDRLSPLGAWSVYAVDTSSGRAVELASGSDPTELSELPFPTAGDGFIVWDELMSGGRKVLWRFDESTGATTRVDLPSGMYPVRPSTAGGRLLFLDNNRDPHHLEEGWTNRTGEPIMLDLGTGQITHLAADALVFNSVLTPTRAVWVTATAGGAFALQDMRLPAGGVQTLVHDVGVTPVWANDHITIWLAGIRGEVTARVGGRAAVVSADNTESPGGIALCGSDLYYAGPNLSLRVAHLG